ncbi:hypothetical protein HZH68_000747 [Vespula germanica]|uniref:Coiled-coil domain-containing protein 85C n=1 Tax=Vespula germanica TaxID=30212 RepID=A0A834NU68_VESGE|nr:hypothetical protein HZH68_000747 [Vespula germanica]
MQYREGRVSDRWHAKVVPGDLCANSTREETKEEEEDEEDEGVNSRGVFSSRVGSSRSVDIPIEFSWFGRDEGKEKTAGGDADYLKWATTQPGAKLAAMSNKSKTQPQQQQRPSHVIKPVDQVPPRYQPPPQPTSGILKNHPHFSSTTTVPPPPLSTVNTVLQNTGQGTASTLTHHHHHHHHQQHQQTTQARNASQQKDAQGKYSPRIEHRHHPQGAAATANLLTGAASTTASAKSQAYLQTKIGQGQYLPPNSQYPTISSSSSASNQPVPSRQRITDEEFLRLGPVEMLKFVRKTESDIARLAAEQNRQIQSLLSELRALKEANQRLSDDNQELRDLCCFLDDDRQKGRKLAREWQRFGRYTASVMRQEVSAYQNKLRQLDNKQQELIKDNLELKELCLYLDEERGGVQRDDGDGSSSSTNAEETAPPRPRHTSTFNDQTMQYVRSLEQRVKQLEEDKSVLQARARGWEALPGEVWENPNSPSDNSHIGSRPEAVVRALQVLEVREQLEREGGHDGEKALVREMCNVVWRKLEEGPQTRH